MPVNRILIERNQEINAIAKTIDLLNTCANRKKGVPATNDRLVCVVCVDVEAAPYEEFGKDVPRRRHTLSGGSAYRDSKSALDHARLLVKRKKKVESSNCRYA